MINIKKVFILLLLNIPSIGFSQSIDSKYVSVINFVKDSIIRNDTANYFINTEIKRETEYVDFHGLSANCDIQHELLLEVLLNGENSSLEHNVSTIIPNYLKISDNKFEIKLATLITYKGIWTTVITKNNRLNKARKWDKYLLIFIDDKLIFSNRQAWHAD